MSKRDTKIDELRGLLMIMVVMGHVVQYVACPDNFDSNIVFRLIYSRPFQVLCKRQKLI